MRFSLADIARATAGQLIGEDVAVDGATIDSRVVRGGELFVPIVAVRDGHDFIADAIARGASAHVTQRAATASIGPAVVVDATDAALTELGALARRRLPDRVAGITGSNGKTSTKDLLASIARRRFVTAASEKSFNNELGVPLTLVNAPDNAGAAVIEMGARGFGHIAWLCEIARPTVGVVTNVGPAHLEMFGSADGVAKAKAELVEALPADGTAVLNAADERVAAMASRTEARVLAFGTGGDVVAEAIAVDDELRPSFQLRTSWGAAQVRLTSRGAHQVDNALAAAAAGLAMGLELDDVVTGLAEAPQSPWRMELRRTASGAIVLNDAYNANPASTEAALVALAGLHDVRRRIAVLGPMLELGRDSDVEHARIGVRAFDTYGIDRVIAVGAPAYRGENVPDVDAAAAALGPLREGDAVLVKASRAAGLERLAALLLEGAG
ncbi:MAG: murF [Acidimicrobiales bacterium]|nr:murF [Acidimicrobiales bacterium]